MSELGRKRRIYHSKMFLCALREHPTVPAALMAPPPTPPTHLQISNTCRADN